VTGYTKLFGSIVASTIWREDDKTRIVWITMLAIANRSGIVEASLPGLADLARVGVNECQQAVNKLSEPDEYSRTKDHDGRRIAPVDGGWHILNHAKYRAKMGSDERREYLKLKQQESRDRKKAVNTPSTVVNNGQHSSSPSTHAEAEAEAASFRKRSKRAPAAPRARPTVEEWIAFGGTLTPPFPEIEARSSHDHYETNGWKAGKSKADVRDWKACLRTCWGRWRKESMQPNGSLNLPTDYNRWAE
jgi:hypothetical protein